MSAPSLTRITTFASERFAVVRLERSDGAVGWGQTGMGDADLTARLLHRHFAPRVLGRDMPDPQALAVTLETKIYKYRGTHLMRALCGLDAALWDLRGHDAELPVWRLLDGRGDAYPVYASGMRRDTTPDQEVERFARAVDAHGFRALKFKVGSRLGGDPAGHAERTAALIPAFAARFPTAKRMVDANGSYDVDAAIDVGRVLEAQGYQHYEEPCPFWEIEATGRVAAALDIPVSGGEQDTCLAMFRRLVEQRVVDVIQPDIGYLGGFSRALTVARHAAEHGLPCTPHSANLSALQMYSLHLMACIPNAGPFLERTIEQDGWRLGPFEGVPEVRDGALALPSEPGWGLRPRAEFLASAEVQESVSE